MNIILRFFMIFLLCFGILESHVAIADAGGFAVVELFTSEGCSDCPAADLLLAKLADEAKKSGQPVYCLSFGVGHWDKQGWKDPFADPAFTRRQMEYSSVLGLRNYFYTPQMVVNGTDQFLGSNQAQAEKSIKRFLAIKAPVIVQLKASATDGKKEIAVEYHIQNAPAGSLLCVAWVEAETVSTPTAGENKGKTLRHVNVVRNFSSFALRISPSGRLTLPRQEAKTGTVIAFVQIPGTGRIIGGAAVEIVEPPAKSH
jgi:hypothetical protein